MCVATIPKTLLNRFKEGVRLPGDQVDIKGLPIKKTTVVRSTGKFLTESFENNVLRPDEIDRMALLRDITTLEARIRKAIADGSTEFSSPGRLGSLTAYADKWAMPVVRGMTAWNSVELDKGIREGDRVSNFACNIGTDVNKLVAIRAEHEEDSELYAKYTTLIERFFGDGVEEGLAKNGLNWVRRV